MTAGEFVDLPVVDMRIKPTVLCKKEDWTIDASVVKERREMAGDSQCDRTPETQGTNNHGNK